MSVSNYLVHIVNNVSGWVLSQVHVQAGSDEEATAKAIKKYGLAEPVDQAIKLIPQVIGKVAEEEAETAAKVVEAEPVPVTEAAALTEAEKVAEEVIASLPDDVRKAIAGRI